MTDPCVSGTNTPFENEHGRGASSPAVVLVVEDDADVRGAAVLLLRRQGVEVREAATPAEALQAVAREPVDAVLLDLNFRRGATSGEEGLSCLADLRAAAPGAAVVVVTAHSGVAMAVAAMRAGAVDFVTKPWSNRKLAPVMEAAAARGRAERAAVAPGADVYLGDSAAARRVRDLVRRAGPLDASVLVWGPAGAGKSLIARALHAASPDPQSPFVEVDVAARGVGPALTLLEGPSLGTVALQGVEMLGAEAGAALTARLASPGSARVVAQSRVAPGDLRASLGGELVYRLATIEIEAPALAHREEDALALADHWLLLTARRRGAAPRPLTPEAKAAVLGHAWPDDARGLRLAVERAGLLGDGQIRADELVESEARPASAPPVSDLNLQRGERALVEAALKRWSFNVSHAARELGLTRAALYRRMAKHGL